MINFRKIASVLASTVMVGSTVAMAAAANFPDPFIKNGAADVAVVWGATAAQTDLVAVTDITSKLSTDLAAQTASGTTTGGESTISGGDFVKIEKDTNKFNMGNTMSSIYSTLDNEELSTVLKSGVYTNDDNNDYDYEQKIALGATKLGHYQDDDFNNGDPYVGFKLSDDDHILNYTLEFTPDAAENSIVFGSAAGDKLETTDLPMLGRTYYIQKVESTSAGVKMTLLDSANSAIVTEGETKTITIGSTSYDISIVYIDTDEVKLNVNGVTTNSLAEGGVYKVAADTYVAVKDIMARDKTGTTDKVEISIGSGKIVLENGKEVQMNEKDLSDITDENGDDKYLSTLTSYITNTSTTISKMVLSWDATNDLFVMPETDLKLPGFETIKISLGGFSTPKQEITSIEGDGTSKYKISTFDAKGDVSFDLFYLNSTKTGIAGIGESATERLQTSADDTMNLNLSKHDKFVISYAKDSDAESYLLEIKSISDNDAAKNTTTIRSIADGSEKTFDVGESEDYGNIALKVNSANPTTKIVNISVSDSSSSGTYTALNRFITKEGLTFTLPVSSTTVASSDAATGAINLTANPTSWTMNLTEEDKDETSAAGKSFTVTLGVTNDQKTTVSSISTVGLSGSDFLSSKDNSDVKIGYMESDLATKITWDTAGDQDTAEIEYHGAQASEDVFIAEDMATVVAMQGTVGDAGVQSLGSVSVKDTEIASVNTKNLIVVGGSCVNTVAAKLLGSDTAICGDAFTTKTGVAAGQYLIETFASPYSSGKVATLVAGFNAGDTSNAAKYLTTNVVDTTVGKKYTGTSATSATLSVTA